MVVDGKNLEIKINIKPSVELAEGMLDGLGYDELASVFNDEKLLALGGGIMGRDWNQKMVQSLNKDGRKHIKNLYDLVCEWYESHPEEAEAEKEW